MPAVGDTPAKAREAIWAGQIGTQQTHFFWFWVLVLVFGLVWVQVQRAARQDGLREDGRRETAQAKGKTDPDQDGVVPKVSWSRFSTPLYQHASTIDLHLPALLLRRRAG